MSDKVGDTLVSIASRKLMSQRVLVSTEPRLMEGKYWT